MEQQSSIPSNNLNALFIVLKILETACEQFAVRQAQKMERKNKQAIMQAVQPNATQPISSIRNGTVSNKNNEVYSSAQDWTGRQQRAAVRQTVKYFESSESEEEDDPDDKGEGNGGQPDADMEEGSQDEASQESGSDEEDSESEQQQVQQKTSNKAAKKGVRGARAKPTATLKKTKPS